MSKIRRSRSKFMTTCGETQPSFDRLFERERPLDVRRLHHEIRNARSSWISAVSWPTPRWSTATSEGRPLIALWSDSRNVPFPGILHAVSHRTRIAPLSLSERSGLRVSLPDHDPIERQVTTSLGQAWAEIDRRHRPGQPRRSGRSRIERRQTRLGGGWPGPGWLGAR